jgi:hypothetical protein
MKSKNLLYKFTVLTRPKFTVLTRPKFTMLADQAQIYSAVIVLFQKGVIIGCIF